MIRIICVGKLKEQYLVNMTEDYLKRINKYHKINIIELVDCNKKEENEKIYEKIKTSSFTIALSPNGDKINSVDFSNLISKRLMTHANIDFIIGGSDGLDQNILNKANYIMSFSDLTFPHGLFRGILLEQIYRAFKIINNETYHK